MSPGIFAVALLLLGSKENKLSRVLAFLFGTLVIGIGIALLGYNLGDSFQHNGQQNLASSIIDLALGVLFLLYGIKIFFSKERKIKLFGGEEKHQILKWIIIGLAVSATNFDALFLSFTAAKEVGAAKISDFQDLILIIVNILFFILPITLPLIVYFLFPHFAGNFLEKVNQFVFKYSRYIIFALFIIFGIYLFYHGLEYFLGY